MSKVISIWEANRDDNFFDSLENQRRSLGELFDNDESMTNHHPLKYPSTNNAHQFCADTISSIRSPTDELSNNHSISSPASAVAAPAKVTWVTQVAKVVKAYKDEKAMGKVGVALLKNGSNKCKIVVYRTKTKMLATFSINQYEETCQLHRQSNYLQFYDDNSVYWSLLFNDVNDEQEFIDKLQENGIKIRFGSEEYETTINMQNVQLKEKRALMNLVEDVHERPTAVPESADTECDQKSKYQNVVHSLQMQLNKYDTEGIEAGDAPLAHKMKSRHPSTSTIIPTEPKSEMQAPHNGGNNISNNMEPQYSIASNTSNTMETQFLHILLSENRTQNTELRMNMAKLDSKIEKLVEKMSSLSMSAVKHNIKDDDVLDLEERLLALKKENRKLKLAVDDRVEANKVEDLEKALKFHKDDLDMLGLGSVPDVDTLVAGLIDRATKYLSDLAKSEVLKNQFSENNKTLEDQLRTEQENHKKTQKALEEMETANSALRKSLEEKEVERFNAQSEYERLNKTFAKASKQHKLQTEVTIKTIMNNLYGILAGQIERTHKLNKNEVLSIIGRTIREETLEAVQQISQ